ncbi:EAL domain-containing protein [Erwinia phyllosphaerae]|uniref:EAL domain-containing protein n=1 Tax=Erwinia phyllosphaerae TaxID=2853256 RepID=UPI001FEFB95A|nr:EAL domain-containing protein [Erwinia phyllosphaerae]MBV4366520.1 EAL domain-containing protein [Erwinia phyllosphaerae]
MNIHLEADYKSYTSFNPIYCFGGQLIAVELLTQFSHSTANVAIPQELLLPQLCKEQRIVLLQNQINSIERHLDFFCQQKVKVTLKIDELLAQTILESEFLSRKLDALCWLELEITESFTDLKLGKDNPGLMALSERFDLSLANYGAGKAPSKAVYDNLFSRIKIDKGFIQHNINRLSFRPFINSILEHIKPHCQQVIVQGVDDLTGLEKVSQYQFDGIQSALFSPVTEESLTTLVVPPKELMTDSAITP